MERAIRAYHDFILFVYNLVADDRGRVLQFTVRVFSSPVGEGEQEEDVTIDDYADLIQQVRELEKRQMEPRKLDALLRPDADQAEMDRLMERQRALGETLADLLLPDYAREMYWRSVDWLDKRDDDGLRLRLRLPDELSNLPWEYLYLQRHRGERTHSDFVALQPRISIVRHEALAIPAEWFKPEAKRRIVIAMATPEPFEDYPKLNSLPVEQALIKDALKQVAGVDPLYVPDLSGCTGEGAIPGAQPRELSEVLRRERRTDIFHFSGHGHFTKQLAPSGEDVMGKGAILLAGAGNQAVPVTADQLLEMIRGHGVRLVVLGACETARSDTVHVWSSVATALQKGEVPAVVAMQFSVYDVLTARFMEHFYEALAAGAFIDEAVFVGRQAIRDETMFENPAVRDWGAPVLYLRAPDGRVFPPIANTVERQRAERRTEGRLGVHRAWHAWAERGKTADEDDLRDLAVRGDDLGVEFAQALLLLRSAVATDSDETPWLEALRTERGERFLNHLDEQDVDRPTGPLETLRILGLEKTTLAERPAHVGPLSWAAASHENEFTRRTAALALTTLPPAPDAGLARLDRALKGVASGSTRRRRRVELRGTLADADPVVVDLNRKLGPADRLGIWFWRVQRRALRDGPRQRIVAQTLGSMVGAGLALGIWRGLIALVGWSEWPAYLNVNLYLGAFLGFFAGLGMSLGESTLLYGREKRPPPTSVARRAFVLGLLFFGVGHFLELLLNNLRLTVRPLMPVTGLVAGAGLMAALYDQPRTGRRLGPGRWLLRLGAAGFAFALAQSIVIWLGGEYPATAVSQEPMYYWQFFRRYDIVRLWMENTTGWERVVMMVDTNLVGIVLALGMTLGLAAAPRWLDWWWRKVGRAGKLSGRLWDVPDAPKEGA